MPRTGDDMLLRSADLACQDYVAFETEATGIPRVTFKTPIPAASLASLKMLKPGDFVTVTARRAAGEQNAVAAVRPFVSQSPASPNTAARGSSESPGGGLEPSGA